MHIFIKKLIYAILMFAVVFAGSGSVICYGADGHMAVASAFDSCCCEHEKQADRANIKSESLSTSPDGCGTCIDIPASGNFMKPLDVKSSVLISAGTLNTITIEKPVFSSIHTNPITYSVSPFFTPLRTIVLLT
jgi:hypothetical protein